MEKKEILRLFCNLKPQNLLVNLLQNESSSDDKYCFTINIPSAKTTFTLNNALPVEFLIDSGSSVNIINRDSFKKLESLMSLTLERSFVKIYQYGCKTPLPILGKCAVEICSNCTYKRTFAKFYIIDAATTCILGKSTFELLCVLTVLQPTRYEQISALTSSDFKYRLNSLLRDYKDIFEGTGALKNFELNIQIDPSVQPYVQKPRRIPFLMKKQVEGEIQKLLDQDFIEPVTSSPERVSLLVCVPKKNGDVRLCVDMRKAITAIIRNYYPIPTLDEILYKVNGAKIFSKFDLAQGYHQIVLDEKSRDITIFSTPQGLLQYKRLIFGAKNAFENFQEIDKYHS